MIKCTNIPSPIIEINLSNQEQLNPIDANFEILLLKS